MAQFPSDAQSPNDEGAKAEKEKRQRRAKDKPRDGGEQPAAPKERPGRKPRAKNVQEKSEGTAAHQTPEKDNPGDISNSSGAKQKKA